VLAVAANAFSIETGTTKKVRTPQVEACDSICLFKQEMGDSMENSFCFKGAPPVLRIGWEWEDTFNTTDEVTIGPVLFEAKSYYLWGISLFYEL
jgi:hypothetical protein